MELNKQVPTSELCKRLKELGYTQEGLFWWSPDMKVEYIEELLETADLDKCVVAPTVAEMGEWFVGGKSKFFKGAVLSKSRDVFWRAEYCVSEDETKYLDDGTEANARAKMLIWLRENKYLSFEEDK